jgi:hypothetical protein
MFSWQREVKIIYFPLNFCPELMFIKRSSVTNVGNTEFNLLGCELSLDGEPDIDKK